MSTLACSKSGSIADQPDAAVHVDAEGDGALPEPRPDGPLDGLSPDGGGREVGPDSPVAEGGTVDAAVEVGDTDGGWLVYDCQALSDADDASSGGPLLATSGAPCSASGAFACAGSNQAVVLLCSGGLWTPRLSCEANQRCDSSSGRCATLVAECADRQPGYAFCDGNTLKTCGPDLVTVDGLPCCGLCHAGACDPPRCGDGRVQSPEECDDGNHQPADGCEDDCRPTVIAQMVAGATHTCALFRSGHVRCWGGNQHGQLGLGNQDDLSGKLPYQLGPIALGGPAGFLVAGDRHTCALMADQSVHCWGDNAFGQLGRGNADDIGDDEVPSAALSQVALGLPVRQVAAGGDSTCALLSDGSLRCWGRNDYGQLGLGHTKTVGDDEAPGADVAQVSLGGVATALALAGDHTCARIGTDAVRCWGRNDLGQLGLGHTNNIGDDELPSTTAPITMLEKGTIAGISAGGFHTCVSIDGEDGRSVHRCWGYNGDGSLGVGYTEDNPLARAGDWPSATWGYRIAQLACGAKHTCLLLNSHDLRCVGRNEYAQLGLGRMAPLGTTAPPNSAPPIDFGTDSSGLAVYATLFATGAYHNCALLNTGQVRCWGMNLQGQLGLGYASVEPTGYVGGSPETVPGKLPAIHIVAP